MIAWTDLEENIDEERNRSMKNRPRRKTPADEAISTKSMKGERIDDEETDHTSSPLEISTESMTKRERCDDEIGEERDQPTYEREDTTFFFLFRDK